jgi:hypothetical protein
VTALPNDQRFVFSSLPLKAKLCEAKFQKLLLEDKDKDSLNKKIIQTSLSYL